MVVYLSPDRVLVLHVRLVVTFFSLRLDVPMCLSLYPPGISPFFPPFSRLQFAIPPEGETSFKLKPVMDGRRRHVLRRFRGELLRHLPHVGALRLLSVAEFSRHFSAAERERILSAPVAYQQVAKLLDVLEPKDQGAFDRFVSVLRTHCPDLSVRLERAVMEASNSAEDLSSMSNGLSHSACK